MDFFLIPIIEKENMAYVLENMRIYRIMGTRG